MYVCMYVCMCVCVCFCVFIKYFIYWGNSQHPRLDRHLHCSRHRIIPSVLSRHATVGAIQLNHNADTRLINRRSQRRGRSYKHTTPISLVPLEVHGQCHGRRRGTYRIDPDVPGIRRHLECARLCVGYHNGSRLLLPFQFAVICLFV